MQVIILDLTKDPLVEQKDGSFDLSESDKRKLEEFLK